MSKNLSKSDLLWGYLSQFLNIGSGFILLPFVLHYLNSSELGLWYIFIAMAGLAQLLEFGFQPTIARQAAYVYSGANNITATGLPLYTDGKLNIQLLSDLLAASRNIYRYVALGASIVLIGIGSLYIMSLAGGLFNYKNIILAWVIYSIGVVVSFYYGYYNGLLQGRGEQTSANKIMAVSRVVMVIMSILLLYFGYALMAMAIASLIATVVGRFLCVKIFFNDSRPETSLLDSGVGKKNDITILLWKSAWRLGLVQLGAFLILKASIFISTSFLGLKVAASYGLTLQLLGVLGGVASMFTTLQMPKMNSLQASGSSDELKKIFSTSIVGSLLVYIVGAVFLILVGVPLLSALKSNTNLLPMPWLILLTFIMLLELNHSISATYLTTLNIVPFVKASIYSGLAILVGGVLIVKLTFFGIGGIIIIQGLVQLSYNNWKWPLMAMKHLNISVRDIYEFGSVGLKNIIKIS